MAIDAGETYVPTAQSLDGLKEGDLFGPYEIAGIIGEGSEARRFTRSKNPQSPSSFSPDGKRLAFSEWNPESGSEDIWTLPLERSESGEVAGKPEPFLRTASNEETPVFSPDGRWLAYVSDESGRREVYVRPFPGPGGKWQVSSGGGTVPIWSRRERTLFFKTPDRHVMAAPYTTRGDSFVAESLGCGPRRSFPTRTSARISTWRRMGRGSPCRCLQWKLRSKIQFV